MSSTKRYIAGSNSRYVSYFRKISWSYFYPTWPNSVFFKYGCLCHATDYWYVYRQTANAICLTNRINEQFNRNVRIGILAQFLDDFNKCYFYWTRFRDLSSRRIACRIPGGGYKKRASAIYFPSWR